MFSNPAAGGKPFSSGGPLTDKLMSFPYFGDWNKNGMGGYSSLFAKKFQAYMSKVHPDNGGSVTMSHGGKFSVYRRGIACYVLGDLRP